MALLFLNTYLRGQFLSFSAILSCTVPRPLKAFPKPKPSFIAQQELVLVFESLFLEISNWLQRSRHTPNVNVYIQNFSASHKNRIRETSLFTSAIYQIKSTTARL